MQGTVGLTGDRLRLGYHSRPVVDGASLPIEAASVTALVGPNGSGKSTLLRALARPTARTPAAAPSPAAAPRSHCRLDRRDDGASRVPQSARRTGHPRDHPRRRAGAIVTLILLPSAIIWRLAGVAVVTAVATFGLVYLISWRGGLNSDRLVLIGGGVPRSRPRSSRC